jgi:bacterioferritin
MRLTSKLLQGPDLLGMLNAALSAEWLAYYQYQMGSEELPEGEIKAELRQHADEELHHAQMLIGRITELGGRPADTLEEWLDLSPCAFDAPTDPTPGRLLEQNIAGEKCAIKFYTSLMFACGSDDKTKTMVAGILHQEMEHLSDLEKLSKG